jgi:radical SAM protein with 4Fe4S-binding SPASM domain
MKSATAEKGVYQDFSAQLHGHMKAERVPASATIELTRRCPLECVHCYNNLPMGDLEAKRGELTYEELCHMMDELVDAGTLWLLLTGGEIFARKDFLDIYTYAKKKGFIVTLFTNGNLITPAIADYLTEWRPFSIEITLYGATQQTYEQLTGIPGSYDRCIRGIRLLTERGLPLSLKSVAISINKHELGAMKRLAAELGVPFKFDAMMNPRIDCSQSPLAVRLEPWEIVKLDLEDPKRVKDMQKLGADFMDAPVNTGEVYHCGGGISSFAIDPEGKMSICVLSHNDTYDLRRGNLREGWGGFLREVRGRKTSQITKCTSCRIKSMCGMCPANGELENGDAESPVDFLCHVAHLRAMTMGIPVPEHGDCEYCAGGSKHAALVASSETLERRRDEVWGDSGIPAPLFQIIAERSSAGACGSCGA